jgi:hypothetical protein
VSSAILYAAIVAIWACVLIPRWLKRDTSQAPVPSADVADDQPAGAGQDAHADGAETMTGDMAGRDTDAGRTTAGRTTAGGDGAGRVAAEERSAPATARERGGRADERGDRADERGDRADERGDRATGYEAEHAETRQRIVSARRRMLLILITLTVAAIGIVGLKLAAWWVAVPPLLMLGGYLMLLREASRADRERALLEAAAYRDEQRRRDAEEQEARRAAEAPPVPVAVSTARVIDISGRVRDEDEIYDQYADGTRRAVGD